MTRTQKIWTIIGLLALAGIFIWAFSPKAVDVQIAVVKKGTFEQTIDDDGQTRVRDRYVISAPVSGKVLRIPFKAGDKINLNQTVADIVPSAPTLLDVRTEQELKEKVGAAEATRKGTAAAVARARATLEKSRVDLARNKKLAKEGFISPTNLEQIELDVKINSRELEAAEYADHAAQHDLAAAKAALMQLHEKANDTTGSIVWHVQSPVSGEVLKVIQESEGVVAASSPLLEVGNPKDLEIVIDVLTTDAVNIHPGDVAQIKGWGSNETLQGVVRRVEPSAFTKISALGVEEQRVNVIIDFTSAYEQWKNLGDGYKVDARIIVLTAKDAIKVPVSALFRKDSQWAVFVVDKGRARIRTIDIKYRSGQEAMVEKGLKPGDEVIVYPGDLVKDGSKIRITQES